MKEKILVLEYVPYEGFVAITEGFVDKETNSHFHIKGFFGGNWYKKDTDQYPGYKYEVIK